MLGRLVRRVSAAEERHLHAAAEAADMLHGDALAAHEPVVAEHRGPGDGQHLDRAPRASLTRRACAMYLAMPMYQVPIDMMIRMISVPRAMKSPCFHSASMPYGFSITSVPPAVLSRGEGACDGTTTVAG